MSLQHFSIVFRVDDEAMRQAYHERCNDSDIGLYGRQLCFPCIEHLVEFNYHSGL